jgi:hypothetical protein
MTPCLSALVAAAELTNHSISVLNEVNALSAVVALSGLIIVTLFVECFCAWLVDIYTAGFFLFEADHPLAPGFPPWFIICESDDVGQFAQHPSGNAGERHPAPHYGRPAFADRYHCDGLVDLITARLLAFCPPLMTSATYAPSCIAVCAIPLYGVLALSPTTNTLSSASR